LLFATGPTAVVLQQTSVTYSTLYTFTVRYTLVNSSQVQLVLFNLLTLQTVWVCSYSTMTRNWPKVQKYFPHLWFVF